MPDLKSKIGQPIILLTPFLHPTKLQKVLLRGVENGGIWIESQPLTNQILEKFGAATAPRTAIFFLPWHQVSFVMDSLDVPSLSEKGLGL